MTCFSISLNLKHTFNVFVFPITIKHWVIGFEVHSSTYQDLFVAEIQFSGLSFIVQISSKMSSEDAVHYYKIKNQEMNLVKCISQSWK